MAKRADETKEERKARKEAEKKLAAAAAGPAAADSTKKRKKDDGGDKPSSKKSKKTDAAGASTPSPSAKRTKIAGAEPSTPPRTSEGDAPAAAAAKPATKPPPPALPDGAVALESVAGLADPIKRTLEEKGIKTLFAIQAEAFAPVVGGSDMVGRARTGCGKTLAFVLPIVQGLINDEAAAAAAQGASCSSYKPHHGQYGRGPRVIVLAPTRELAKQVAADFDHVGKAARLTTLCVYGGAPYGPQEGALRRGVDVVVGTPGRVKDHLERGTLKLQRLRFRVLDECDEMLNMGFVDDVEKILNGGGGNGTGGGDKEGASAGGDDKNRPLLQTLLFSATMPSWVREITRRFLRPGFKTVDLVAGAKLQAATTVRHLILPCHWTQRAALVTDLVKAYGLGGRSIVFTETKNDANELAGALSETSGARALHGDIAQAQREATLDGFRSGKFSVLVATDVAARGLDVTGIELVVQVEPPKEPETYVHRSGRTGRAGRSGVCVTLVGRKHEDRAANIERRAGVRFERIGAPQPAETAKIAAERALDMLRDVDGGDGEGAEGCTAPSDLFGSVADSWLSECGGDARRALSAALAKITGHTATRARSLLTAHEGYTTLQLAAPWTVDKPGYVYAFLKRRVAEEKAEEARRMTLTKDGKGAIFDVPSALAAEILKACKKAAAGVGGGAVVEEDEEDDGSRDEGRIRVFAPTALPELVAPAGGMGGGGMNGGGGFGGGGFGGRGGGYGGRGGYGGGGGRGGGGGGGYGGRGGGGGGFGGRGGGGFGGRGGGGFGGRGGRGGGRGRY
jgi:ATP-dependent RNA helicase DDX21